MESPTRFCPRLNYNYFRDFDPNVGRYVESDPIGLRSGVNSYAYANGSPINFDDPSGLQAVEPDPIEPLPPSVEQSNRWNDPWRQLRREFPYNPPVIPTAPQTYCWETCPTPGTCKVRDAIKGVMSPMHPGCYVQCSNGPFLDPSPNENPPTPTPPPRDMTRGDWYDLFRLLRTIMAR
jgi:uncharacterized protein RhaS with RHS repeats